MASFKRGMLIGLGIFVVLMAGVGVLDVAIIAASASCDPSFTGPHL